MKKAITAAEAKSITNPGSYYAGETLTLHHKTEPFQT